MRLISACTLLILLVMASAASAQGWQPPADSQRCPSKWGAGDQRGAGNHMKPETVLRAARLIKTGEVFELGRVLSGDRCRCPPAGASRSHQAHAQRSRHQPSRLERGARRRRDRSGRHAVRHLQPPDDRLEHVQLLHARGRPRAVRASPSWVCEQVGALVTRGVLIDVAALKGVPMLAETYEITPQDLQAGARRAEADAAARRRGAHSHRLGHALGQGQRALSARRVPASARPPPNGWRKQDPMLVGADNTAVEDLAESRPAARRPGATRSCWSSTASTCSRIFGSTSSPRGGRTSSR